MKKLVLALIFVAVVLGFVACSSNTYTVHVYTWDGDKNEYKDNPFSGIKAGDSLPASSANSVAPGDGFSAYYELTGSLTDSQKKAKIDAEGKLPTKAKKLDALTSVKIAEKNSADVYVVAAYIPKTTPDEPEEPEEKNKKASFYLYDFATKKYETTAFKAYDNKEAAIPATEYALPSETLDKIYGVKYLIEVADETATKVYRFIGWTATKPADDAFATGDVLAADSIVATDTESGASYYSVYEETANAAYAKVMVLSFSYDSQADTPAETQDTKDYYLYVGTEDNATVKFDLLPAGADRENPNTDYTKFVGYYTSNSASVYAQAIHLVNVDENTVNYYIGDDATTASTDIFTSFDANTDLSANTTTAVYSVYKALDYVAEFYAWDGSKYDLIDTINQTNANPIPIANAPAINETVDKPAGIILAIESGTKFYKFKEWVAVDGTTVTALPDAISATDATAVTSFVPSTETAKFFTNYVEVTATATDENKFVVAQICAAQDSTPSATVLHDSYGTAKSYNVIASAKFADFAALLPAVAARTNWDSYSVFDKWVISDGIETDVLHEIVDPADTTSTNKIYVVDDYGKGTPAVTTTSVGKITVPNADSVVTTTTTYYAIYKSST